MILYVVGRRTLLLLSPHFPPYYTFGNGLSCNSVLKVVFCREEALRLSSYLNHKRLKGININFYEGWRTLSNQELRDYFPEACINATRRCIPTDAAQAQTDAFVRDHGGFYVIREIGLDWGPDADPVPLVRSLACELGVRVRLEEQAVRAA